VVSYGAATFDKVSLLTTTQHRTLTNRRKPSAAEKGFRVHPQQRHSNSHAPRRRPSRAQRPGQAQRRRGVRGSLPNTTQQCTPTCRRKPSAVAKPSEASRGFRGSSLTAADSATRPCAKEAKRSDHAERSGKRVPLDYNSNPRSAKLRMNSERRAACKTNERSLCFDFSSSQGATIVHVRNAAPEKKTPISAKFRTPNPFIRSS
jgi:hypothetical protein